MANLRFRRPLATLALLLGAGLAVRAGTVITTNLPAGTLAIVNIDATNDGAYHFTGDQSTFFDPYALNGTFAALTLGPGKYTFDLIDPADSVAAFPSLTPAQRAQLYSGWTFNYPWITDYFVFDSSALNDATQPQLFCGAITSTTFASGEDAYHAAKAGGYSNLIFTGPGGRYHGVETTTLVLTRTQTLLFVIPDYYDPDNAGGVSVVVRSLTRVRP